MTNELHARAGGRDAAGGLTLIGGSALTVFVMAHHPTGHDLAEDLDRMATINRVVHGAAIAALPLIVLGLRALRRRLGGAIAADAAVLAYGFAAIAWMLAAVASGFVQTDLFLRMHDASDERRELYRVLSDYTHMFNQAFADVGVVASAAAIGLMSWRIWRSAALPRALGVAGIVVAAGVLVARLSGHVALDVHGFGAIVLAQSTWFVAAGALLLRGGPATA